MRHKRTGRSLETGEPCAVKAASTVRGGVVGNVPSGNALATYSTTTSRTTPDLAEKSKGEHSMAAKRLNAKGCNVMHRKSCTHGEPGFGDPQFHTVNHGPIGAYLNR
jgi:hypothetical protein